MLATSAKTNAGLIRRLLSKLSKAGLVDSKKGKDGGNTLCRSCTKISMRDVYEAISDTPLFATFEKAPEKQCNISCQIGEVLCDAFKKVEKSTLLKMEDIKVNDLAKKIKA
jgi:DNA-binding IscR family transcriptional regulator